MRRNKLLLTTTLIICFSLRSVSQSVFGIKVDGGMSKISSSVNASDPSWTNVFQPSYNIGVFYKHHFTSISAIGIELLFENIQGKENFNYPISDVNASNPYRISPTLDWIGDVNNLMMFSNNYNGSGYYSKQISYLTLPIYYSYSIKKFSINLGFQVSYMLESQGEIKGHLDITTFNIGKDFDQKYDSLYWLHKVDYGIRFGINYSLSNIFSIEANYYLGLSNISEAKLLDFSKGEEVSDFWKVQQITLGLKFNLTNKESK